MDKLTVTVTGPVSKVADFFVTPERLIILRIHKGS